MTTLGREDEDKHPEWGMGTLGELGERWPQGRKGP